MNNPNLLSVKSDNSEVFSVKEIAENIGASYDTVNNSVKRLFPDVIKNGKKTLLNKEQVTVLLAELKSNKTVKERMTFEVSSKVDSASTALTPALKIKQAMELMQEGYEEELAILRAKNLELKPKADAWDAFAEKDGTFCVTKVASCLNLQPKMIFSYLEHKGYISHSSGRWAGTVLGTTTRGYISNDVVAGDKFSTIQMRLTVKGMQKVAEAFGKTRESIELTAEAFAEKGSTEYERILAETTEKWLKKNSLYYRSE